MTMAHATIPFSGSLYSFEVPDRNLAEILSPKPSEPLPDLDGAIRFRTDGRTVWMETFGGTSR